MKNKLNQFITIDGRINVQAIRSKKLMTNEIKDEILLNTKWFDELNPTIGQRIKAILLNINEIKKCRCGNNCTLSGYKENIFNITCGNENCIKLANTYDRNNLWKTKFIKTRKTRKKMRNNNIQDRLESNNYLHIKNEKLLKFINLRENTANNAALVQPRHFTSHIDTLCTILHKTRFINIDYNNLKWNNRFYCIKNNLSEEPTCKCGQKLKFYNLKTGYSNKCKQCGKLSAPRIRAKNAVIDKLNAINKCRNIEVLSAPLGLNSAPFKIKFLECGHINDINLHNGINFNHKYCPTCNNSSKLEYSLYSFINSFIPTILHDRKTLLYKEIDILIPSLKIGIEFNGNYWHAFNQGAHPKYHLNKTEAMLNIDHKLIHIFEDEWINKTKIVKSRLKSIIGKNKYKIFARKCEVREISTGIKTKFLEKYHIQGTCASSVNLGLFYKSRLVAVMTFGKRRYDNKNGYELIRYCTIGNFTIIGGASKLLKYFERKCNPIAIITYADRRWSEGNLYKKLGFNLIHTSPPNYWYIHSKSKLNRESRIKYQKHKLSKLLDNFDPNKSEWENMKSNGYDKIYDCGNLVFEKHYK